jgi:hypothetical protein
MQVSRPRHHSSPSRLLCKKEGRKVRPSFST